MNNLAKQAGYFIDVIYSDMNNVDIVVGSGISGLDNDVKHKISSDDSFIKLYEYRDGQYNQVKILQHFNLVKVDELVSDLVKKICDYYTVSTDIISEYKPNERSG